eukprot:3661131-Lingulodinium_polyedra.AAC.1
MFDVVRHLFDEALVAEYISQCKANESPADFISKNESRIAVCLPLDLMRACVAQDRSWAQLAAPICEAVSCSRLGEKLFGWCERKALSAHMGEFIEMQLVPEEPGAVFGPADFTAAYDAVVQEAKDMGALSLLQGARTVEVVYAGLATQQTVTSIEHEFRVRFAAWAKTNRLGRDLPLLPFESKHLMVAEAVEIEPSMIEKFREARLVWRRLLNDSASSLDSAESIKTTLLHRRHMWANLDKT